MTGGTIAAGTMSDFIYIANNMVGVLGDPPRSRGLPIAWCSHSANLYMYTLDASGHSDRVPMGSLSATYSSAVLGKLVDVWFNGVAYPDTPEIYKPLSLSGMSLYGSKGVEFEDINQGPGRRLLAHGFAGGSRGAKARPSSPTCSLPPGHVSSTANGRHLHGAVLQRRQGTGVRHGGYATAGPASGLGELEYARLSGDKSYWVALAEKAYAVASGHGWVMPGDLGDYRYEALDGGFADWSLNALSPSEAQSCRRPPPLTLD